MPKQLITVLVALSFPLAGVLPNGHNTGNCTSAWAADTRIIADVDYNAGINKGLGPASQTQPASSVGDMSQSASPNTDKAPDASNGSNASGQSSPSGESNTPGAAGANATGETPAGTGSNTTGQTSTGGANASGASGASDASLESIWSETPVPSGKGKTKKKNRTKSKSSKVNNTAGANADGSADLSPSKGSGSSSSSPPTATSAPPSSDLAPSAVATPSANSTPSTVATPPPTAHPSLPSDFGAYPAIASPAATTTLPTTPAAATSSPVTTTTPLTTATTSAPATPASASYSSSTPVSKSTMDAPSAITTGTASSTPAHEKTAPADNNAASPRTAGTSNNSFNSTNTTNGTGTTFGTTRKDDVVKPAPLCATHTFFQSELIRTVSWPGVGPFKGDTDPNDLADPQENRLTLQTNGDKLTSAELFLMHQPGNPQGFINLQMVMDFMLEALGARDKKINDFNGFLEKNKEKLLKRLATETKPLTTTIGAYLVSIASSRPDIKDIKDSGYFIQVKSKNTGAELQKSDTADSAIKPDEDKLPARKGHQANSIIATNIQPANKQPDSARQKPSKTTPAKEVKELKEVTESKEGKEGKEIKSQAGQSSADSLKQEFADTIRNWQSIKKVAVRNQDSAELSKVLSGKSLNKQTVAIGWLVKNKYYYDLNPKGVAVDHFEEMSQSPKRYAVYAQVKEDTKLMDQTSGKQLSESDDQYNVKYSIERSGDHWTIYDSDLIKPAGAAGADQSKGKTKPKPKH